MDLEFENLFIHIQKPKTQKEINLFINNKQFRPGIVKSRTRESVIDEIEPAKSETKNQLKTQEKKPESYDKNIPLNFD